MEGPHSEEKVAIKIIELEHFQDKNLEEIRKEIQIMKLSSHQNILNYYACFISETQLWMIMPIMECGSIGNILRYMFREGFDDEVLIASILKEVLQAIVYFHEKGQIHRDIKAGNILLSSEGKIFLADFGVSSNLRVGNNAKTLTGSPCWMAPEVMESNRSSGYNFKADIWSFGITAIELAKGAPPYIDQTPMKVILLVKNSNPPVLGRNEQFDSNFKDVVNLCLQKDPEKRPTAEALLEKRFFRKARGSEYIYEHLVTRLPPLEHMVNIPRSSKLCLIRDRLNSESDSWDFNISSEIKSKSRKSDDPLAVIGADEEGCEYDPLDEIQEKDD